MLKTVQEWGQFCFAACDEYLRTGLVCLPPSWSLARCADPYPFYARLRAHSPVHRSSLAGGVVVSRAADIQQVLKDDRFTCDATASKQWKRLPPDKGVRALILEDGESHRQHRSCLAAILNSQRSLLTRLVESCVERGVHHLVADRAIDLMEDFVAPMIRELTLSILGIPAAHQAFIRPILRYGLAFAFHHGDRLIRFPRVMSREIAETRQLRRELQGALDNLFPAIERKEGSGIVPELLKRVDGGELTGAEAFMLTEGVLSALFEPLSFSLGNTLALAGRYPEAFLSTADSEGQRSAVARESLRFEPAVQAIFRYARDDGEIGSFPVARGENIVLLLGSANRDRDLFRNPDRFDPKRSEHMNFAFGSGPHACLGAGLTQSLLESALRLLRERFDRIEIVGPSQWQSVLPLRGLGRLPVVFREERRVSRSIKGEGSSSRMNERCTEAL